MTGKHSLTKALTAVVLGAIFFLAGCANPQYAVPNENADPYEEHNRKVHEFNKSLDSTVLKPASKFYANVVPPVVAHRISSFSNTIGIPSVASNFFLQGNWQAGLRQTTRFFVNATAGIGGLFDAASKVQIYEENTDFGQTMYVWGIKSGPLMELPVIGPSNPRDATGALVDYILNPVGIIIPDLPAKARLIADSGALLGNRAQFAATIDSLYYDSADSYVQLKLYRLQNRRFRLTGQSMPVLPPSENDAPAVGDNPYDDPYMDPYADPYSE